MANTPYTLQAGRGASCEEAVRSQQEASYFVGYRRKLLLSLLWLQFLEIVAPRACSSHPVEVDTHFFLLQLGIPLLLC